VGAAGKVLESRVRAMVPRSMFAYYSFSRIRPLVPRRTSTYYLQSMASEYVRWSPSVHLHGLPCVLFVEDVKYY
jgi:hypothetical protein